MTNLTEQWKKGELPSGWYYVRLIRGEHHIDLYINSKNEWIDCPDNIIDTVVCKVPSYEEYKDMQEENTKLKERNDSLNNRDINLCRIANGIRDENFALKELLKECIIYVDRYVAFSVVQGNEERKVKSKELLTKINQVLGEE